MNRRLSSVDLLRLAWLIRRGRGASDPAAVAAAEQAVAAYRMARDRIQFEMGLVERAGETVNVPAYLASIADDDPVVRARAAQLDQRAEQRAQAATRFAADK